MPYTAAVSFDNFLANITPTGDLVNIAAGRKDAIVRMLGQSLSILDVMPTGSLVRGTGLRGTSDLDVIVTLHYGKHLDGKTPRAALELVRDALSDYNAQIIKKNGQAVTLYFTTWPNVDIVPAKRVTTGSSFELQIADMTRGNWITTDPIAHDYAMSSLSPRRRALVRMVKCWNRAHSSYFQSFHIEQVVLESFSADLVPFGEDGWPWALRQFFEKALEMTTATASMSVPYTVEDWSQLRSRLRRANELSSDAWSAVNVQRDVEAMVTRCRILFGDDFPTYG